MTLEELKNSHAEEVFDTILAALQDSNWRLGVAADALGVAPGSLSRTIGRIGLADRYAMGKRLAGSPGDQCSRCKHRRSTHNATCRVGTDGWACGCPEFVD